MKEENSEKQNKVTRATNQLTEMMRGGLVSYSFAKGKKRQDVREKIEKDGGTIEHGILTFPCILPNGNRSGYSATKGSEMILTNAVRNKLKKYSGYRENGFDTIDLLLIVEDIIPLSMSKIIDAVIQEKDSMPLYNHIYIVGEFALLIIDSLKRKGGIISIEPHVYREKQIEARQRIDVI